MPPIENNSPVDPALTYAGEKGQRAAAPDWDKRKPLYASSPTDEMPVPRVPCVNCSPIISVPKGRGLNPRMSPPPPPPPPSTPFDAGWGLGRPRKTVLFIDEHGVVVGMTNADWDVTDDELRKAWYDANKEDSNTVTVTSDPRSKRKKLNLHKEYEEPHTFFREERPAQGPAWTWQDVWDAEQKAREKAKKGPLPKGGGGPSKEQPCDLGGIPDLNKHAEMVSQGELPSQKELDDWEKIASG